MMNHIFKGVIISSIIFITLVVLFFIFNGRELDAITPFLFFIPVFIFVGVILGFASEKIKIKRFRKLFLLGLFIILSISFSVGTVLTLADSSSMLKGIENLYSIFFLGIVGFIIFSFVLIPVLLVGTYVLEKWTRPNNL